MKILTLLLFIFAVVSHAALPQTAIDLSLSNKRIGEHLSFFEDANGTMTLSDVMKLPDDAFQPLHQSVDSHLFTTSTFWYRFRVQNNQKTPLERMIVVEIPWIDSIHMTVLSKNGVTAAYEGGNIYPYKNRALDHRFPNFQHDFLPEESVVYLQVKTRDPYIIPISVVEKMTFLEDNTQQSSHASFIYGIIIAMLLYNLFLYLSIKAKYYAYYVAYLSFFLIMNLSYNGYTFKMFFPEMPEIQNWMQSTTIFLFSISGLLFAKSFLNVKKYSPLLYRSTNSLLVFFTATMFLSALPGYHYHVMFSIALSVVFSIYVFSIAIYSLLKGNRSARYFLLGTTTGLIGTSITALTVMALIPYSDIGFKAVEYGMAVDTILLSLALADRMSIAQKEKLIAEKEAKTDPLTGLLNRRAYHEIASIEVHRSQRYNANLSVIMLDIDLFKNINDTYGHTAGDKILQKTAAILQHMLRESDYTFRMGGEEFLILLPETGIDYAALLAERIRMAVNTMKMSFEGDEITITVSLGISEYQKEEATIEATEKRADEALYRAKSAGRNRISL